MWVHEFNYLKEDNQDFSEQVDYLFFLNNFFN